MKAKVQKKKKIFCKQNIPNILVVVRMVMTIAVVCLIIADVYAGSNRVYYIKSPFGDHQVYCYVTLFMLIAGGLFVLASFTDFLDGFLARKYHWVSDFGKLWDPIADKVLVNSTLICLCWHGMVPIFIPVIMIARDVIVDAKRMVAAKDQIVVAANIYGKMKTVLQMLGIIFIFFICCNDSDGYSTQPWMWWGVQNFVLYAATIVSVISGVVYFKQINKQMKHGKQN